MAIVDPILLPVEVAGIYEAYLNGHAGPTFGYSPLLASGPLLTTSVSVKIIAQDGVMRARR